MSVKILPYKRGSVSAKALAEAVGGVRLKHNSNYTQREDDFIVNWGCSDVEVINRIVNQDYESLNFGSHNGELSVVVAGNKLKAFNAWKGTEVGVSLPKFTTSKAEAQGWVDRGRVVVCRHLLRASGSRGIEVIEKEGTVPDAPLYVRYIKKQEEYRVHVFCGEAIDVQRKMRKADVPDDQVNWQIRNHCNGFIFGREGVDLPEVATQLAINAVHSLGLDFGAVDLIYNAQKGKYYLLEVNCAPGLEGSTLEYYSEAIGKLV